MISKESLEIVQATVEVVRENGLAITGEFYKRLFDTHPELKNLFNMSNQANRSQQQALASAVYAYAANINNPEALDPVLSRIAHKHASLGITPAQYTIVGRHLMAAIKTILGEAATAEILAAWDEAYWLLACDLVAREAKLYAKNDLDNDHWISLKVIRVEQETDLIKSLYLSPVHVSELPTFKAGQYISVVLEENGFSQIRQYSLSDCPSSNEWRITVKKETSGDPLSDTPDGYISTRLHEVTVGETLRVSYPYGDFTLNQNDDAIVMISAGVGITPMVSMLKSLARSSSEKTIHFYHAANDAKQVSLASDVKQTLSELNASDAAYFFQNLNDDTEQVAHEGRMDLSKANLEAVRSHASFYLCGPLAFMQEQRRYLLSVGVDTEQIQYEVFGSDLLAGLH